MGTGNRHRPGESGSRGTQLASQLVSQDLFERLVSCIMSLRWQGEQLLTVHLSLKQAGQWGEIPCQPMRGNSLIILVPG